jgi:hypothetical protein
MLAPPLLDKDFALDETEREFRHFRRRPVGGLRSRAVRRTRTVNLRAPIDAQAARGPAAVNGGGERT